MNFRHITILNFNTKQRRNFWFSVALVFCFSVILLMPARAQDMVPKIGVAPHTFELGVLKGQVFEGKIKIFNQSDFPIPMTTRITDFTAAEDSGQMLFDESSQDPSFASRFWFRIENPDFILDPGEVEEVRFKIQVPDNAEPGGHYAVVIFEPRFPSFYFKEKALVKNIPEIGVLFLTSVQKFTLEPEEEQKLEVVEFSLPKEKRLVRLENFFGTVSRFVSRGLAMINPVYAAQPFGIEITKEAPSSFVLRIKNNDIYHLKPFGKISIYNFFGRRVGEIKVPQKTILPGRIRIFPVEFEPEIPEKLKWLPAFLGDFLVQNFFVGKYQAKLELQAKSPVAPEILDLGILTTLSFFSLPWKFWLGVTLILGLSIFYIWRYRDRIKSAIQILFSSKDKV